MDGLEARVGWSIRGTHPYCFRSGVWATVQAIVEDPETCRPLYLVEFVDEVTDWWDANDLEAGYEFRV